ncbi:MAG TPA: fused MFS/spermidine synthase, partial [Candidatus Glassbacteria bacterium]|nr:fused MFS/spermidine synthase [Candidatus Glassbacteria bacterium]
MRSRHTDNLLYICFFLSGASGLVFEVVWMRKLSLVFGSTVHAVSTVVAVFMGGLALGSWLFGKLADRGQKLLRLYVWIEAGIAASGAAISLGLLPVLDTTYVFLHRLGLGSGIGLFLVRFFLSVAIMLGPTVLMGGTLPVVGRYLVRSRSELGARLGSLYGLNTLGAVAGTLAAGFWLIMLYGETATCVVAAFCNLTAAALALAVVASTGDTVSEETPDEDKKKQQPIYSDEKIAWVPWLFGVSGFAALAYEVLWTRALIYFVGLSVHAFTIILACFLVGIALGSLIATSIVDRWRNLFHLFGALQWVIALSALASLPLIGQLNLIYQKLNLLLGANTWTQITLVKFCLCLAVLGLPTLAMGAAFPVVNRIFIRRRSALGRGVGALYAANTAGTILGSLGAGFLLLPLFGISGSLVAVALINAALAAAAVRLETTTGRRSLAINISGAILAAACGL